MLLISVAPSNAYIKNINPQNNRTFMQKLEQTKQKAWKQSWNGQDIMFGIAVVNRKQLLR